MKKIKNKRKREFFKRDAKNMFKDTLRKKGRRDNQLKRKNKNKDTNMNRFKGSNHKEKGNKEGIQKFKERLKEKNKDRE